jgi:hypothetical protein
VTAAAQEARWTDAKLAAVFAAGVALLASAPALGAPVSYGITTGALTTVQFVDLTTGQASPCPIGGSNCLTGALNLTGGVITVDEASGALLSVSLVSANTGTLAMGGFNGYSALSFSNLSFVSSGASPLVSNGSVGSVNLYSFGPVNGTVTTDLSASLVAGGTATLNGATFQASPFGSLAIDQGASLSLNMSGVNLGVLCDPFNTSRCVLVKADFHANGTPPIPEPTGAALFALGLAAACARLVRRRTA